MTAILSVRTPLANLSMASTQRGAPTTTTTTRRRSARHAFADEDDGANQHHVDAPVGKKAKKETAAAVNGVGKAGANGTAGTGTKAAGGRRTRAAAYDEDDDGFTFSRARPKKSAAKKTGEPEPEPAEAPPPKKAKTSKPVEEQQSPAEEPIKSTARKTRKSAVAAIAPAVADEVAPKRRRSARLSAAGTEAQPQQQQTSTPAPEKAKRTRKSTAHRDRAQTPKQDNDDGVALVGGQAGEQAESDQPSREGTKIALPFADTPIIKRNKEMRKGGGGGGPRRSSTGLRGRRASSLIDSGTSNGGQQLPDSNGSGGPGNLLLDNQADDKDELAVPHAEVPAEDFYKHIEQSLPEPRRMKQLLTWCGTRALTDKPSGEVKDASAVMAARAIQQELLNDFASKSEMSNWFDREDVEPAALVKKPNPRNLENATKLEQLEQEVKRLQEEKKAWESLLKTPSLTSLSSTPTSKDKGTLPDAAQPSDAPNIDPTLLDDPEQARILASLNSLSLEPSSSTSAEATSTNAQPESTTRPASVSRAELVARLQAITASLEPQIDLFADGLHKVSQYRDTAERVATRVLGSASERLEERDREVKRAAGTENVSTRDVLRALAGTLNRRR
ncbi:mis12-mtw1 family protein [Diplodia corticola]|uniref:Mis12-mtw1 family protein n=1 Tax=Diplodia corticola TaxID=236234 RepID=A0A1J9QNX1_9PEZI|nr:mis12-mtw1 family protein [Diplodia corticola]OJD30606.1 mis12-mtw1 family protein [Diplodia corticola]